MNPDSPYIKLTVRGTKGKFVVLANDSGFELKVPASAVVHQHAQGQLQTVIQSIEQLARNTI